MHNKSKYSIGEVSKISSLSVKALRFYDEKGILKPLERDDDNNYRYYSEAQIFHALIIWELRRSGFSLQEIQKVLQYDTLSMFTANMEEKIDIITKEIEKKQQQLRYAQNAYTQAINALSILERWKTDAKSVHVSIETMPSTTVLYSRNRSKINASSLFWDRYADLLKLRDQERVTVCGPATAVFYDHYTNRFFFDEGDMEIFFPIVATDKKSPHIKLFGGFQIASSVYVGRYKDLLHIYVEMINYIDDAGYRPCGPVFEQYLTEFFQNIKEDEYVTKVCIPIVPNE